MRVAAVVVTFNRPALLARCLASIGAQSEPPEAVIVFDNGNPPSDRIALPAVGVAMQWFSCPSNAGSAGGFHFGLREAFAQGFDAAWLMDDDGVPDTQSLHELKEAARRGVRASNALVVDENDPERLAFPIGRKTGELALIKDLLAEAQEDGMVRPHINFFNGTLVTRAAFDIVGNVKAECFIWGDEVDYQNRMLRQIPGAGTVPQALHRHPRGRQRLGKGLRRDLLQVSDPPRLYILARNVGFNRRGRRRFRRLLRLVAGYFRYAREAHGWAAAFKVAAYTLDGGFNTYLLAPSRRELRRRLGEVRRIG